MHIRKVHHDFFAKIEKYIDYFPREVYVLGFFSLFFLAIIWRTFSYTVLDHNFYQGLADTQQIGEIEVPVTRGSIYASTFSPERIGSTVLGTSVYLSDIAVDPQMKGDKSKLAEYLTNMLYDEMCAYESYDICYNNLLRFLKVLDIPNFQHDEVYEKKLIAEYLVKKISQTKVTSVLLDSNISLEDEQKIASWNISGVYPSQNGLYVNPEELTQTGSFSEKYSALTGEKPEDIIYKIRKRDLRYIPIYNKLSLVNSDALQVYLEQEKQAISQGILKQEDSIGNYIILTPHAQRIYPENTLASQVIGFMDNEGNGHYGLEGYYDELLRGNPGELKARKDVKGRSIEIDAYKNSEKIALEGVDIYTTIDRNIQRKVEQVLKDGVEKYRANRGSITIMDPNTGKIIAMANYPSFDPNNVGEVYDLKRVNYNDFPNPATDLLGRTVFVEDIAQGEPYVYNGTTIYLREALREEYGDPSKIKYIYKNSFGAGVYQNDSVSGLYEPGSVMKSVTVAIGIDTGEIRPTDFYNDQGSVTIDNFTIKNVASKCLGYNTFQNALNYSCNVGMIRIVQKVGKALLHKYLYDFGFGAPTGITLAGEVYGKIDPYEKWPMSKLLTTSYGLGIGVTPLQMAAAYSVLVNGGIYYKPYIVDSIVYKDGEVIKTEPEAVRRVIKPSTSDTLIEMLVDSVEHGVAGNAKVEGYTVGGKTGTAEITYKGRYETGVASTNGSFVGFAPAEDPKFVMVIKLERMRTTVYGGETAAYLFADIAEEILNYYQIPRKVDLTQEDQKLPE